MAIETDTITMPAHWASYLINGDASGMEDNEQAKCDTYIDSLGERGWRVVGMVKDSERFTWSFIDDGGSCIGGNIADYVVHKSIK